MDIKACTVHSPSNTQHYTVSVLLISSPQSTLSNLRSGREVRDFWVRSNLLFLPLPWWKLVWIINDVFAHLCFLGCSMWGHHFLKSLGPGNFGSFLLAVSCESGWDENSYSSQVLSKLSLSLAVTQRLGSTQRISTERESKVFHGAEKSNSYLWLKELAPRRRW